MKRKYRDYLQERNGWWYVLYTIPASAGTKAKQKWKSLNTRDERIARMKAGAEFAKIAAKYETLDFDNDNLNYENVRAVGAKLGIDYVPDAAIETMSTKDAIEFMSPRLVAHATLARTDKAKIATLGGAVPVPALTLTQAYARFKEISPDKVAGMTERAANEKWGRYERKVKEFISVIGDVDVLTLPQSKVNDYRAHLYRRHANGEIKTKAANQYLEHLRAILRPVIKEYPGATNPFENFERFTVKDAGKKEPFTEDDVRMIRAALPTSNLTDVEKAILLIAQNTGAGVKELALLAPEDIVLTGKTPHIKIRPNAYRNYLKADDREREVPLIGMALTEMQKFPNGFETVRSDTAAQAVTDHYSEFLRKLGMGRAARKTFGSYRHRIASLLRKSKYKDQYQDAIMGHATPGMTGYYGDDIPVADLYKALEKVLPKDNR